MDILAYQTQSFHVHISRHIPLHMTLLFYVLLIHGYATPLEIVISRDVSSLHEYSVHSYFHVLAPLLHRFTDIHALIVSVFMLQGSLFILHELLLHGYSCIPVT